MSSKPGGCISGAEPGHFGRMVGSPPALPGGGMTGVLPASGVGARISGSTPEGGQITPSDLASWSPSVSVLWPVVVPSGAAVPFDELGAGPQFGAAGAGAVAVGGGAFSGGACATAAP